MFTNDPKAMTLSEADPAKPRIRAASDGVLNGLESAVRSATEERFQRMALRLSELEARLEALEAPQELELCPAPVVTDDRRSGFNCLACGYWTECEPGTFIGVSDIAKEPLCTRCRVAHGWEHGGQSTR